MLTIDLGIMEYYNEDNNQFIPEQGGLLNLEYSLKAVYEWEGIYKKSFFDSRMDDGEFETLIRLMADREFDRRFLTVDHIKQIGEYISQNPTATTFTDNGQNGSKIKKKKQTSEEIYAIMFMNNIPLEWENRNLNRLMTVLRIVDNRSQPPKKMSKEEVMKQNRELNRQRKAQMNTRG